MDHFIDQIRIQNFKSIRELEISGCKRINLFIGRPNVGKSNILEALSLFSLKFIYQGSKRTTDLIRLSNTREIFWDGSINTEVCIEVKNSHYEGEECCIEFDYDKTGLSGTIIPISGNCHIYNRNLTTWFINSELRITKYSKSSRSEFVKPYKFSVGAKFKGDDRSYLQPPFGSNLLQVLELLPELRQTYAQWFRQYGLRLVLDTASQSLKVQKEKGDDEVFQLPYSSVADTLQRIIFFKTAVASNENSVLLFEEPEAHSFPPYIVEFTQEVIQSITNQFFIVTHSPLIVEEFLTDAIDDLGIFNVDFKDGQTVVRALTTEEIYNVRKYGVDLFFNNEAYLA